MIRRMLLIAALVAGLVPAAFAQFSLLSKIDKDFATQAAMANTYEIQAALLANQYSSNPAYRRYTDILAFEQTEISGELESAVVDEDPSFKLPTGVSATGQQQLNALKNARNVDLIFRSQIIAAESATLRLYQGYTAQLNANKELRHMAQQLLPTLQRELTDAQNLPL